MSSKVTIIVNDEEHTMAEAERLMLIGKATEKAFSSNYIMVHGAKPGVADFVSSRELLEFISDDWGEVDREEILVGLQQSFREGTKK